MMEVFAKILNTKFPTAKFLTEDQRKRLPNRIKRCRQKTSSEAFIEVIKPNVEGVIDVTKQI